MPEGILEQKKGGAKNVQMKRNRKRRTLSAVKKKRKTQRNIRLGFLILGIVLVVMLIIKINNPGFFFNKYYEVDTKAVDASEPDIDRRRRQTRLQGLLFTIQLILEQRL